MEINLGNRLKHAWNAFRGNDFNYNNIGPGYSRRPDRPRFSRGNERSIVNAIYNRIAVDCSLINVKHVRLDENGRYKEDCNSELNDCLTLSANKDQTGRMFIHDLVQSMLDEGVVAAVPIDTDIDPSNSDSYIIETIRTAKIVTWYADSIRVRAYDERNGREAEFNALKKSTAICENPFYAIMNEHNSVAQRLIHKMNLLDYIDEQSGSGKLDLIIQLPYTSKTSLQKGLATQRKQEIEDQLVNSKYGIAYLDATEKITQLNRSVDNNLLSQIEGLTRMLYSQLGMTEEIMNGTADDSVMTNYYSRTIEPIMLTIVEEMKRKFLTKSARTRGHSIEFYRDPFKLISVSSLADLVDKTTRNEVMSPNEWRQIIGLKPSNDPQADALRNRNISQSAEEIAAEEGYEEPQEDYSYE